MANATPVHSKSKDAPKGPEAFLAEPTGDVKLDKAAEDALHEKARAIVAAEVPAVPDELVGSIGQATSYGKYQRVSEVPYDVMDRKGEPTGKVRNVIRIDH